MYSADLVHDPWVAVSRCRAAVLVKASTTSNPSVLVIMGAQASARQRYNDAIFMLKRAVMLDPKHARLVIGDAACKRFHAHWCFHIN